MSEWISWAHCPDCGETAAVGWVGDEPVEMDCIRRCAWRGEQPPVSRELARTASSRR